MGNFKKLTVWQIAKDIAINIYRVTDNVLFKKILVLEIR
jgi:hypothetical protein